MSVTYTLSSESIAISSGCLNFPKPVPSDPHLVEKNIVVLGVKVEYHAIQAIHIGLCG